MAEINHYFSDEEAFQLDTVAVRLVKTREPLTSDEPLTSPEAVVRTLAQEMSFYDREVIGVINFDTKMRPINVNFASAGTLNSSLAHPREIMKSAILSNAASMMMIHNHPSQDITPSREDIEMTGRMAQICALMNIPLLDHIIVGDYGKNYFSFADENMMPKPGFRSGYKNMDFTKVAEVFVSEKKREYKNKDTKNNVNEITKKLSEGVKEIFEGDNYKKYLNTISKFHNYSTNNTILIARQNPEATLVAGFKSWENNFNRHVKKGEKGIKIIAPSPYKKKVIVEKVDPVSMEIKLDMNGNPEKEETEIKMTAYRIVSVFDVSQTEGEPLPQIAVELTDNVNEYEAFMQAIRQSTSIPIEFEDISDSAAKGYFDNAAQKIVIRKGMSESQSVKTAIHELAHSILHNTDTNAEGAGKDRQTKEVEAESVAYTVCSHFGIDTSDYSFGYIAGWSSGREADELKQSLETIRETSSELINSIEHLMPQLKKDVKPDKNVTESVTQEDKKAEHSDDMTVKEAIESREHTYYGAYADIGTVLDNFTTDELIEHLKNNELGGESSLRNYVESQITSAQINRERYQSENENVTESVTPDNEELEVEAAEMRM